jgi:hypothetical protein
MIPVISNCSANRAIPVREPKPMTNGSEPAPQTYDVEIVEDIELVDTASGAAIFNAEATEICDAKDR